ncbi:MAG: signal peptidase II, partial [Ignavibacteria bacterium]|nr:signal peptidase II [Ignavibacteria bacterium]
FFNVDFFDFTVFGKTFDRWPIFNIADATVTVGVIILLIFHRTEPVAEKEILQPVNNPESTNELNISETSNLEMNDTVKINVQDNNREEN